MTSTVFWQVCELVDGQISIFKQLNVNFYLQVSVFSCTNLNYIAIGSVCLRDRGHSFIGISTNPLKAYITMMLDIALYIGCVDEEESNELRFLLEETISENNSASA